MAEIHIIGEIVGAIDYPKQNLFCKWNLEFGTNWKFIAGKKEGQTQVSCSLFQNKSDWHFPVDVHFATTGIQGWPKLYLQVFYLDWLGRCHLFGYGFLTLPTTSGLHKLRCYTWKPFGSIKQRFTQFFLGGGPHLKHPGLIFNSTERYKLNTESMGIVILELNMILRNFYKFGIEYK